MWDWHIWKLFLDFMEEYNRKQDYDRNDVKKNESQYSHNLSFFFITGKCQELSTLMTSHSSSETHIQTILCLKNKGDGERKFRINFHLKSFSYFFFNCLFSEFVWKITYIFSRLIHHICVYMLMLVLVLNISACGNP